MPERSYPSPEAQHAYKMGFRFGVQGKGLEAMPSTFRTHPTLRSQFIQGLEAGQQKQQEADALESQSNWRYRITWFVVMVIGGLATAMLLIDRAQSPVQKTSNSSLEQPVSASLQIELLTSEQRQDLQISQQEYQTQQGRAVPLEPTQPLLDIELRQAQLFHNGSPLSPDKWSLSLPSHPIPKTNPLLEFQLKVRLNKPQSLCLNWYYQQQSIQEECVELNSGPHTLRTQQLMRSARQGQWRLELRTTEQHLVERWFFDYGNKDD
ncbi:MAG: hypothetical protein JXR44_08970 [Thiotrichales bacterium]|nr:hypothetical protein [Thiotrichales bacterium]